MSHEIQIVKIGPGGRIVIPANIRAMLSVKEGDSVFFTLEDNAVRLSSQQRALMQLQALALKHLPDKQQSVDAFLAFRKQDAGQDKKIK